MGSAMTQNSLGKAVGDPDSLPSRAEPGHRGYHAHRFPRRVHDVSRSDPLDYPFGEVPAPTTPTRVAPGVSWVRMPLPFALDHINLWMLDDGDDMVLVDTGFGTDETRAHWRRILEADGRRISGVVVTHFHPDHLGLAAWIAARDDA